jgi:hypothetical protein
LKNVERLAVIAVAMILTTPLVLPPGSALAQDGVNAMQVASERMQAEQALAQANAARPGDELLTCEQIQTEMGTTMNTDAMRTQRSEIEASAQRQQELQQEASERARGQMTTGIVTGVISSFVPGAGYAQAAAMQAQAAQQQADAEESQSEMAGMIGNMSNMMPAMMRGQRLGELAQANDCAFAQDMPRTER